MRKLISYIATSLDGKIAKADGDVSWLDEIPNPDKSDYGYADFIKSVDTTLMGNGTYQQILGFDVPFPYTNQKNYVFSRSKSEEKDENVTFVSDDIVEFAKNLKNQSGQNIWLIGGGEINAIMLNAGLIDEIIVFVMPIVVGKGIALFSENTESVQLELIKSKTNSSGALELIYHPKYQS